MSLECSSVVDPLPSGQNGCFPQSKLRFLCAERRFPRLGSARDEGGAPHEVDGSCQLGGNHALVGEEQVQLAGLRDEREETHLQAHEVEVLLANPQAGRARGREGGGLWDTATWEGGPLCLKLQSKLKQRWDRYTLEFVCDVFQCILSSVVRSFAPSRLGMVVDWSPGAVRRELPCAPAQVGEERAQRRAEGVRGRRRCP